MQVSKEKYARTHTERHYQACFLYLKDALILSSKHGEGLAFRKLIRRIHQLSPQTSRTEKYNQSMG